MVRTMSEHGWNQSQLFSSARQTWATPWPLFKVLDEEFKFSLDAAASSTNAKCENYISMEEDSLSVSWLGRSDGGAVWLNPPYGRNIGKWLEKAYQESIGGAVVVCLTFCRSDTRWWHKWAMRAAEIRLIPGRITFVGAKQTAPAPSCLIVFDESRRLPRFTTQSLPRRGQC